MQRITAAMIVLWTVYVLNLHAKLSEVPLLWKSITIKTKDPLVTFLKKICLSVPCRFSSPSGLLDRTFCNLHDTFLCQHLMDLSADFTPPVV
jgi:hypothetical protein